MPPLVQSIPRYFAALLRVLYPPQCLGCEALVDLPHALCPVCWRETPMITGLSCDSCGMPLPGAEEEGRLVRCDDCLRERPPWAQGRAALLYEGGARALVLQLKHADRLDLARPLGAWMYRAAAPLLQPGMLVAPIPLHWTRLARRRYNQSALLAAELSRLAVLQQIPDLLQRHRRTPSQEGRSRAERHANVSAAFRVAPRHLRSLQGASVLLVDDVMTSGATLAAASATLIGAGAGRVSIAVLARVPLPRERGR